MTTSTSGRPMTAFVQLAHGFGGRHWRARWDAGKILGINEPQAYGYHRAAGPDVTVVYSQDAAESALGRLVRLGARAILGFDLVHAWRNRRPMLDADVIWTHTESQTLAVLALLRIVRPSRTPRVVGQVVWLIDRWHRQPGLRRLLFRWLLRRLDVMTVLSVLNLSDARGLFPGLRVELVRFGICADDMRAPTPRAAGIPLRLASLGNDEHRDWTTLAEAMALLPDAVLRIASGSPHARQAFQNSARCEVGIAGTNDELLDYYDSADLVVVTLRPNRHASGITVIAEAMLRGIAVIASDAGGLQDYFDDTAVCYVPAGDSTALARAVTTLGADPARRAAMIEAGQRRIRDVINSGAYARRHVELSRGLLGARESLPHHPRIAIGIATIGRPAILSALLRDLQRQTVQPDLVVVSYASPADIADISTDGWAEGALRFITGQQGSAVQRNVILDGLHDMDIVLFLDDDFFPHATYLREMVAVFREDTMVVGATGHVIADGAQSAGLRVSDAITRLAGFDAEARSGEPMMVDVFNTYGCNMAFRLATIREHGVRFDEQLPLYAWYEDIDFSRTLAAYGRIVCAKRAGGVHLGTKSGKSSGLRLGYSQIANPVYLGLKGTYPWNRALRSAGRHLLINTVKSLRPEPYIDRKGRARGNLKALYDLVRRRMAPDRILTLR